MSVLPVIALIEAIPQVDYYLCETVYITSGLFWDIFGKVLGYALSCLTLLVEVVVGGHIFYMKYFIFFNHITTAIVDPAFVYCWANSKPKLGQRLMFAGNCHTIQHCAQSLVRYNFRVRYRLADTV